MTHFVLPAYLADKQPNLTIGCPNNRANKPGPQHCPDQTLPVKQRSVGIRVEPTVFLLGRQNDMPFTAIFPMHVRPLIFR